MVLVSFVPQDSELDGTSEKDTQRLVALIEPPQGNWKISPWTTEVAYELLVPRLFAENLIMGRSHYQFPDVHQKKCQSLRSSLEMLILWLRNLCFV